MYLLSRSSVDRVRYLLSQENLSQRQVAAMSGVSRGRVSLIAKGEYPDYEAIRRERLEGEVPAGTGPVAWCAGCGHMVYGLCVACQVRAKLAERSYPRDPGNGEDDLSVCLFDGALHRYRRIRRRKQAGGPPEARPPGTS